MKTETMKAIDRTAAAAQELIKAAAAHAETMSASSKLATAAKEFLEARTAAISLGVTTLEWKVQLL